MSGKVVGTSDSDDGVLGASGAPGKAGVAGVGESTEAGGGNGVYGRGSGNGVFGISLASTAAGGAGVCGTCDLNDGVRGYSMSKDHSGVVGTNNGGGVGVLGQVNGANAAVVGVNRGAGAGVVGSCDLHDGVQGYSMSKDKSGVVGTNNGGGVGVLGQVNGANAAVAGVSSGAGPGIFGKGSPAGRFEGDVEVTGDIRLTNADCAENFNIGASGSVEPGTVMVLGEEDALFPSERAYDKRVAGVVSGAGDYKPGIVLDRQQSESNRQPIALLGKVYCKVDASYAPIEVGDLLTTAPTLGHAMKAGEPLQAFGAVIGKALRPLAEGQGLIPILIALQ